MHRPIVLTAALAASLILPSAATAADVGGPAIVSFLNAQRAAQGLPAGITEEPRLSAACAQHNRYASANRVVSHDETEGRPGYSAEGRRVAQLSVLYGSGGRWTSSRNPFEEAPIHLHQLLAPRLDRVGAAETGGYGCATTLASRGRPAPAEDVSYSYPGDGATGWPTAQTAAESPYTPGSKVGIPAGARTGPYLYVLFDGPDLSPFAQAQVTRASLSGPDGPRALATVDNTTPGLGGFLPPGAQLIPRTPLRPQTTYTASVTATVRDGGVAPRRFSRTWSFTTGAAKVGSRGRSTSKFVLAARLAGRHRRELRVHVSCSRVCGVVASGTVRVPGRTVRRDGRRVRLGSRTVRLRNTRAILSRRGTRTLRLRLSARDARRLTGRGRRMLRLRVSGVDRRRNLGTVTLRG